MIILVTTFNLVLTEVVETDIEDGSVIEARLDLHTDRHYFMPWEGEIKVGAPMQIKAQLELSEEDKHHPGIKTKLLTAESHSPPKSKEQKETKLNEEDMMKKIISEVVKQLGKGEVETLKERKVESPKKETKEVKKAKLQESLKNITEEDIYTYMTRAGTKNPRIQEIVLDEARKKAESGDLLKVFKEVVKALKKPVV